MLDDPARAAELGGEGRRDAERNLALGTMVERLVGLYETVAR